MSVKVTRHILERGPSKNYHMQPQSNLATWFLRRRSKLKKNLTDDWHKMMESAHLCIYLYWDKKEWNFQKSTRNSIKKNSEQRNLRHKKKKLIWCGLSLNLDSLIPFLSITLDLFLNEDKFEELICFFKRFCYKYANYCKIIQ